jgi:hypothetical protein
MPTLLAIGIAHNLEKLTDLSLAAMHRLADSLITDTLLERSDNPISRTMDIPHRAAVCQMRFIPSQGDKLRYHFPSYCHLYSLPHQHPESRLWPGLPSGNTRRSSLMTFSEPGFSQISSISFKTWTLGLTFFITDVPALTSESRYFMFIKLDPF